MIDKITYFYFDECPNDPGKYCIRMDFSKLENEVPRTDGSFNVLGARLMNMSWPDYLRFCRDVLGAEIIGQGHLYPIIKVSRNLNTYEFVRMLNLQMNFAMWLRAHPNWKEHQDFVEQYEEDRAARREMRKNAGQGH